MTLRQRWSDRWSWPMLALACVAFSVFMQVSGLSQAAALESEHLSLRPAGTEFTYDSPTCISAELVEGLSRGPSTAAGSIGSVKIAPYVLGCDYDPSASFVAPSSRLVPGGGLAAHELVGGHTLARHVGLSADDLAARLAAQPNIPAASTFSSRATAEASIASTLDTNQAAIQAWLRGGGGNAGSAFTTSFADPVGTTLIRGASGPTSATSVRVVLRPYASMPGGFRILTAFRE